MEPLKDILERVSDFHCIISGEETMFTGVLLNKGNKVSLRGRVGLEQCNKINHYKPFQVWGNVQGTPITLLNCYFESGDYVWKEECESVDFSPSEIVIGRAVSDKLNIKHISTTIPALNYMFSSFPFDLKANFSKTQPSILDYTFPERITVDDKYGHINVYQTFGYRTGACGINFEIRPVIEYQFYHSMETMDAVGRIATVRNLFSFFANYNLPLNSFSFSDEQSPKANGIFLDDCSIFLNHNENIPEPEELFLITTSMFSDDFPYIWEKWLLLYEEAKHIPTLFYEIICDRSTRTNRFLNLAQAVEVYSCKYRENEAKRITDMQVKHKRRPQDPPYLRYRFEDVFTLLKDDIAILESIIAPLSKALADMRNFFTHYGENHVEPSYQEMLAACHILEFVLLAIIYHTIGISAQHIQSCKKRVQFQRFDEYIDMLLNYSTKSTQGNP